MVLCSLIFAAGAVAQEVLAPPPRDYSQKTLVALPTPTGTNQVGMVPSETTMAVPANGRGPLDWGPVHLTPHLLYSVWYGNGLQAAPGQQSKTLINQISPGLLFELGNHWRLDYTPTMRFYSSSHFHDGTDQSVALNGGTTYQDWIFGLSQSYVSSSTPLVETGSQTDQETFSTAINAGYQVNSKVSMDAAFNQNLRLAAAASTNQFNDSRTRSATAGLDYQLHPRLAVGIGATVSYDDVRVGSDMTSEQLQGRIKWHPGEKLTLSFTGGFEDRQFLDSARPALLTPVFTMSLLYRLFDPTTISLIASRTITPSYFQDQLNESTGFAFGIQQRLLKKLSLSLNAGYSTTSYQATTTGVVANRQDDHTSLEVRLSCPFLKKGTASVFYDWSNNASNEAGFSYTSNQAGIDVGYRF